MDVDGPAALGSPLQEISEQLSKILQAIAVSSIRYAVAQQIQPVRHSAFDLSEKPQVLTDVGAIRSSTNAPDDFIPPKRDMSLH